jgi:sugar lactone lactonase YvrE
VAILAVMSVAWILPASSAPPAAAEPGLLELAARSREARIAGDRAAWLKNGLEVLARAPEHPELLLSAARAYAANGHSAEALDLLGQAVRRGARADPSAYPEFKDLAEDERFAVIESQARNNLRPVAPPEEFLVIEDTSIEPEGIGYDELSRRLFIGSLNGTVWQIDMDGRLSRFAGPDSGLQEVLGLKVDRERRLLWAATGVFPDPYSSEQKPGAGRSGLLALHLDDGRRVRDCWLDERPVMHGFNDMAIAADGDVYASDSTANSIYRLPAGTCRFERVIEDPRMSFPNGIALSADDARLYVAHIEGLSVIDLADGRRAALAVPPNAATNSIDGLVRDGEDLIGIQPSQNLARVVRIRLVDGGTAVRDVTTVSAPPPPGLTPTTGAVVGAQYYSVAGVRDAEVKDRRARILRAKLR